MSDEIKEESNNTPADVKEEVSSKVEEKTADESSKDSEKSNEKEESAKEESVKSESGKEDSEDDDDDEEEEMALLDRPVEVTGCRARKKVERLEYSAVTPKEKDKQEIQEGKGQKLGECPRIHYQIQRYKLPDIKPLHKILYNRVGAEKSIKGNIRKFSGFPFEKNSPDFKKKKAIVEKMNMTVLKQISKVLDLESKGSKDDLITRILEFLLNPKDSGKPVVLKKHKRKGAGKKSQKKKAESKKSDEEADRIDDDSSDEDSDKSSVDTQNEGKESDEESKKKSKATAKSSVSKNKAKKVSEKSKKENKKTPAKGSKRKREESSDSDELSDEDKPLAKKSKMPSDDEITKLVKRILDSADLQEITMKKVIKQVSDAFPDFDLAHKKTFIKSTIKSHLNV